MSTPAERLVAGMRCSEVLAALSDFLDGELPAATRDQILAHLRDCNWCEHFGGRMSDLIASLRRELSEPAPLDASIARRLRDRLSKENT
jgi:anti-sigma factor RsiW